METVLLLGVALALALIIKSLFVQAFYIPSPSMEPQFIKDDRILVQKISYWGGGTPQRGDIVVFEDPGSWLGGLADLDGNLLTKALEVIGLYPSGGHLVKRVIGIGGDRVVCCDKKDRITINGVPLNEKAYLPDGVKASRVKFDQTVPEGHLWMLGDNRNNSSDSREHLGDPGGGMVPESAVVGKAWALMWPPSRMELIHRPKAFDKLAEALATAEQAAQP